jgi:outer membrane protein assembly factor BamB
MRKRWALLPALFLFASFAAAAPLPNARPFDWPQWQGPERNGVSAEKGLLQDWPKDGPPLAWKVEKLGGGFSAPAVANGRIYGMSYRGNDEVVWALDEKDGKEIWATVIAGKVNVGYGSGPRCTPTVDGNRVYAEGIDGDLVCLDAENGQKVWAKNLVKDFGGGRPGWGYCESPLIDGDVLVATPAGRRAALVALKKASGEMIWQAQVPGGDARGGGYSSPVVADIAGVRQYVQLLGDGVGVVGVAAKDGKFLWGFGKVGNGVASITTPIVQGDQVFASSAYNKGAGLIAIKKSGDGFKAEQVYFSKDLQNHHGGMILLDGYLYGAHGGNGERSPALKCLDLKTGEAQWESPQAGKGSLAYADGRLYYRNENGPMILVEANPKKYVEHGRFNQPGRSREKAWPHPVIANGKLYLRDQDLLLCYDIKQK